MREHREGSRTRDAQPHDDPSGTDLAEVRRARGSRFERSVAAVAGVVFLVDGGWAFFAPASFFEAAATFEPYNVHLISHLIDRNLGGDPAVDIPVFGLTAVLLVAAALSRAAALRR